MRAVDITWGVPERVILKGVSVDCRPGTVTGLLGPNGSGKTSLLHVLAGLLRAQSGQVYVGERSLRELSSRDRARQVAVLEQHAVTGLDLPVRQVIELGRIPHRGRWPASRTEGRDAIDRAVRLAEVADLLDRRWQTLSGGERQRVQLARALAQEPEILILDEPTNHLDLGHQIDFLTTVRRLGLTVIAALHDLDLAAAFCDQLVLLQDGEVVASGDAAEVLTPATIHRVYGVQTSVGPHPESGRLHVVWHHRVPVGEFSEPVRSAAPR
ncbi:MAG: ABC transporter ATP-binding protein [Propionibacteriales bacterium]|nr:ABC transporter ATP-binding protein [Propionibacteriales bacterium]